jgi:3-deoxy-manno-octulosonate cytidylyltransferase (CMP-KDO synthetase)
MNPIVLIPARMAATRLPDKPLADIGGLPLIVRVLRQAEAAAIGPVIVAAGDVEIVRAVEAAGGRAVLTDPDLPSGSDRILAALALVDPGRRHDVVINLQGDIPFADPALVTICAGLLETRPDCDISTIVVPKSAPEDLRNPDVVKAIVTFGSEPTAGRALYFTRSSLYGDGPVWHHIGVYGYRRAALERFTAAPPSPLERREKLEQLRALELGLSIWAAVADQAPIEVNSPEDLVQARAHAESFR